jgi:PAS domain-containing protein
MTRVNRAFEAGLGFSPDETLACHLIEFVTSDEQDRLYDFLRLARAESGLTNSAEFRMRSANDLVRVKKEAIFERYKQVDPRGAEEKSGTGLGLAICKTIVEAHGGCVGVDSEPGQGSQFWFQLMRSEDR